MRSLALSLWSVAFVGVTGAAFAQSDTLASRFGSSGPLLAAPTASHLDLGNGLRQDLLLGRNMRGPYALSWKNFRAQSETVERDGVPLQAGADYTIQPETGAITFTVALRPNQIARVAYRCDTPNAALNQNATPMPLDLQLLQVGANRLAFRSVLTPEAQGSAPFSSQSFLQFSNAGKLSSFASTNTDLFLDLRGGDWLGRSAFRFTEGTRLRDGQVGFNYSRAGAQFAAQNLANLAPGREIWELNGNYAPIKGLGFQSLYRQTTQLLDSATRSADSPANGPTTRELSNQLQYALPKGQGSIEAGRTQITTVSGETGTAQVRDTVRVARTLAPGTQASVGYEAQSVAPLSGEGDRNYSQNTTLNISSRPISEVNIVGTYRNAIGTAGAQDYSNLRFEATPLSKIPQLRLTAGWEDQFAATGARRSRDAMLFLPTLAYGRVQLSGGFRQMYGADMERMEGVLNASLRPARSLEIVGNARFRNGLDADFVDGYALKAIYAPLKNLRFTTDLLWNPAANDWAVRRAVGRNFGLETNVGLLSLRAQYGTDYLYLLGRTSQVTDFSLGFRLSRYDTLTTQFRGNWLFDASDAWTNAYSLAYTRNLGALFSLTFSGSYTMQSGTSATPNEYRGDAQLGLKF